MYSITKFLEAATENAAALNRKIIEITQRNLNLGFELAKSLARGGGNPSEIVRVQTSFWRKQFHALATQAEEACERLFGFNVAKPKVLESAVEEPAKKSPTRSQRGHNHPPQASATARLRQKAGTQTPKTPRSSSTDKLKRTQDLRDPVDEGAKLRAARTKPASVPRAGEGAETKPAAQTPPTDIKFGMLDGNAVRFTNFEAWWLVDGNWRPVSPDEILANAAVMREARFKQLFRRVQHDSISRRHVWRSISLAKEALN
jgi:Phasin protein